MKYKIRQYKAVAAWHWDIPDSSNRTCTICRQDFDSTCGKCRIPGDDCPIIFGKCKHYFHLHCIDKWNREQKPTCPLCRAPWEIDNATETPKPARTVNLTTPVAQADPPVLNRTPSLDSSSQDAIRTLETRRVDSSDSGW